MPSLVSNENAAAHKQVVRNGHVGQGADTVSIEIPYTHADFGLPVLIRLLGNDVDCAARLRLRPK